MCVRVVVCVSTISIKHGMWFMYGGLKIFIYVYERVCIYICTYVCGVCIRLCMCGEAMHLCE